MKKHLLVILLMLTGCLQVALAQGIPTTVKVWTAGGSTYGNNVVPYNDAQASVNAMVYDQNGNEMNGRKITLSIINAETDGPGFDGGKDNEGNQIIAGTASTTTGTAIAYIPNSKVGRYTIVATDDDSRLKGYCYVVNYNKDNNLTKSSTAEGNVHTVSLVSGSNKGFPDNIVAQMGDNADITVNSDEEPEFTLDLGAFFDIDLVQVRFINQASDNYSILFSKDGTIWSDAYTCNFNNRFSEGNTYNDAYSNEAVYLQGYRYVKFHSAVKNFQFANLEIYGVYRSNVDDATDTEAPTVTAVVKSEPTTNEGTRTSSVVLSLYGTDDKASRLEYIINTENGLQYTTSGVTNQSTDFTLDDLTPGATYRLTVRSSDGYNLSDEQSLEFTTPALNSAPVIESLTVGAVTTTGATINYTVSDDDKANLNVLITGPDGNTNIEAITATKNTTNDRYEYTGTYNITGLESGTVYNYTVRAYDGSLYSGFSVVTFTTESTSQLVVTFRDGNGLHENTKGTTGKLKEIINKSAEGEKDITKVTELTVVSGALNGADIATLRQMACGNDFLIDNPDAKYIGDASNNTYKNPDGWQQGSLATLDLSNATFAASNDIYLTDYTRSEVDGKVVYAPNPIYIESASADIPTGALAYCSALTSVVLPTGNVLNGEFYSCANLQKVTVKDGGNVQFVGVRAFQNCDKLTTVGNTDDVIDLSSIDDVFLKERAFFDADAITNVKLSTELTVIPDYAFQDCDALTTVNFDDFKDENSKLKTIGYRAFCDSHKLVLGKDGIYHFPKSITTIDDLAFANIDVQEIYLPINNEYTTISESCFGWNGREDNEKYSLTTVHIPANVTSIKGGAFQDCPDLTGFDKTIDNGATISEIGGYAFNNAKSLTNDDLYRLIKDVAVINDHTFNGCKGFTTIDLTKVDNGITTIEPYGFAECSNATSINLGNKIGEVKERAFYQCFSAETADLGTATKLGKGVFENDKNIKNITVNTAKAPEIANNEKLYEKVTSTTEKDNDGNWKVTETWYDPFANIPANQVTINFNGDAAKYDAENYADKDKATGYMSYRNNIAFMRLLTKHLNEGDMEYNVAGQMHADVILQRNFKAGYNTLALPFGSPANMERPVNCAKVYSDALFRGNTTDKKSHISAFRGTKGDTFMFLYYENVETDPLDEFEPILVYMDASDITAGESHDNVTADYLTTLEDGKQYYRFENVDVNYDNDNSILYSATDVPVCVKYDGKHFDGNYNRTGDGAIPYFKYNTSDYVFTGTYTKITVDAPGNSTRIKTGDYIIQNSKFYKVIASKKYRMSGFRGWFTKNPDIASGSAKASLFTISDYNRENGTPTAIETIDAETGETLPSADVFNLNGQCVRHNTNNLNGLPQGIYIWNGRKVVVK